jgi:hypothetical protein
MLMNGMPHLSLDFFTSFASRRAGQSGILSAWVGTILVMLVTAMVAVPLGVAPASTSKNTPEEQPADRHHRDQHHQSRRRAVDHLRSAGAGHLFVYTSSASGRASSPPA